MKKTTLALFIVFIATSSAARADIFDLAGFPEQERYELTFVYSGIELKKPPLKPFNVRYVAAQAAVEAVYDSKFVGEGATRHLESTVNSKSTNGYKSKYFFRYKPGAKLYIAYYEKTVTDNSGNVLHTESTDFTKGQPAYPETTAHPFTLHNVFRGYDFQAKREKNFYVWFNPTMVFGMKVALKAEEKITVPAGTFDCYKLEMLPDLVDFSGPVVGKMIKPFVAKYQIWLDKTAPHKLVKYSGPFGQVNVASAPSESFELKRVLP